MQIFGENIFGLDLSGFGEYTGEIYSFLNSIIKSELSITSVRRMSQICVELTEATITSANIVASISNRTKSEISIDGTNPMLYKASISIG